jgi:hypothetical protein
LTGNILNVPHVSSSRPSPTSGSNDYQSRSAERFQKISISSSSTPSGKLHTKFSEKNDNIITSICEELRSTDIIPEKRIAVLRVVLRDSIPARYHQLVGITDEKPSQLKLYLGIDAYLFLTKFATKTDQKIRKRARRL